MAEPQITVLMATYNRCKDLQRVLRAYEQQDLTEPFELLIVDDASPDDTVAMLRSYQPQRFDLHVEQMEKNSGQGMARNRAIPLIKAPLVLFTGDDVLPGRHFLRAHLTAHRRYAAPEMAILGRTDWPPDFLVNGLMTHIDGMGAEQFSYHYLRSERIYDYRHFYTSNISVKRELLLREGHWFDHDFTMYGYEDIELGYRLERRGMQILYAPVANADHYHYHTIYSFATRQYRSGRMAVVMVQKHPQLADMIYGRSFWTWRLRWQQLRASWQPHSAQRAQRLEAQILRLCAFYEWQHNWLVDWLYIRVLNYYYNKGIMDGTMKNGQVAQRTLASYACRSLGEILLWFLTTARQANLPLPEAFSGDMVLRGLQAEHKNSVFYR